jgi:hypothetical protein
MPSRQAQEFPPEIIEVSVRYQPQLSEF